MADLTQMPVPGLDGITREDLERELRGALYKAQEDLGRAAHGSDPEAVRQAQIALDDIRSRMRAEHMGEYNRFVDQPGETRLIKSGAHRGEA